MTDWTQRSHAIVDKYIDTLKAAKAEYESSVEIYVEELIKSNVSKGMQDALVIEMLAYINERTKELG